MNIVTSLLHQFKDSLRDLLPVVAVMAFFQLVVIGQPLPASLAFLDLIIGLLFVVVGLTLFIKGLELGLFPLGENLARAFVAKGSIAVSDADRGEAAIGLAAEQAIPAAGRQAGA